MISEFEALNEIIERKPLNGLSTSLFLLESIRVGA